MKTTILRLLTLAVAALAAFAADAPKVVLPDPPSTHFVAIGSGANLVMEVSPRRRVMFGSLAQCEYAPENSAVYLRIETAEQPFVEKRGDKWVIIISKSL